MTDVRAPDVRAGPGLTGAAAAARLAADGPNVLPAPPRPRVALRLGAQLVHFFALMLWVAGTLAFLAGMPQLGVAIFVVVVVNGVFAFAQEYRAERATDRLKDLLPVRVTVRRDGLTHEIDASELVVGDLVLLAPGDRISADLRLADAHALAVDTSTLTGESVPEAPGVGDDVFAGTFVVSGEAEGVVTATGGETRLAGIASLAGAAPRPRSPLAIELDRVVRIVGAVALGVGGSFFLLALAVGTDAHDGFLFAIGVTVALVPEGLLPTVTLSLAMGAQRMAGRHALVRRLEAVETLGSTTFICTDKTGTLTRNEMSVVAAWTPAGPVEITGSGYEPEGEVSGDAPAVAAVAEMAVTARRCSIGRAAERGDTWVAIGDPMEAAIDVLARRAGDGDDAHDGVVTRRFPFDSSRRRMSVVTGRWLNVKGAPDTVMPRSGAVAGADDALHAMTRRGLRVLAVARRPAAAVGAGASADEAEHDLELLGLLGFEDPPRAEAAAALVAARRAGLRIAMVTGDHPFTAMAIAREVGLAPPGHDRDTDAIDGSQLPADEDDLGALLDRDGIVVSRVTPEDKLRIARALRARGHVVAMTGDGVNDGPALRASNIGVAMGRVGTDVAREAADLVLLDDNFATIVAAVEHGRATFTNIRRFLTYHLTDNVAELTPFVVWALSGGRFPLALGVLQILCLDIGTDLLPALALGGEPPSPRTLERPPHGRHLIDRAVLTRVFGVLGPTEAIVEMAAFVVALMAAGWAVGRDFPTGHALEAASGAAFSAVVLGQAANAFACRSATRWPGSLGWGTNRLLVGAVGVELVALIAFLVIPPIANLLDQAPPPWPAALTALAAVPAVLVADAAHKALRRRRGHK